MKKQLILAISIFLISVALADSAIDGLTLALHPNGETLVVGGDTRTLYTIDASSLDVLERTYFGSSINKMAYSPDGSVLFVQDSEPDIYVLDAETLEIKSRLAGFGMMQISNEAKLLVAVNADYSGDSISIFDVSDSELKSVVEISFDEEEDIASMGVSPDGSKMAVFFDDFDSETEEKVSWGDIPEEYKGFAKDVYNRQHDGKESRYMLYSIPDLEVLADYISFYTPYDDELVFFRGSDALITNTSNENARYSLNGDVEMWEWDGVSSAYGAGVSNDHNVLVVGSYSEGTVYDVVNNTGFSFDIDDVPGQSEYFRGFSVAEDGTIYGTTDAYRIVKIKLAGTGISKDIKPVY